jgi:GDP-4-dehydro-6-deoxy-D-mannose reductase
VQRPVLVTGAAGFAGSHLLDLLRSRGERVEAWSRPDTPAEFQPVTEGVRWKDVELLDPAAVRGALADLRPGAIYHCAGAAHVGQSWQASAATLQTNVLGTHHLLEADRTLGLAARILVPGSATVYRAAPDTLTEESPIAPASPYALSKLAQEQLGVRAAREGQHVLVTRSFNHFGPRQAPSFAAASFARQVALVEHGRARPVLRVGNLAAERDLTDVRDTVRAYVALVDRGAPGVVYNVCTGRAISLRGILDELLRRAAVNVEIEVDPALYRPNDAPRMVGDNGRITRDTGWTPVIPLDRTVDDLLAFWRDIVHRDPSATAT